VFRISNHHVSSIIFSLLFVEFITLVASVYVGSAIRFHDGIQLVPTNHENFLWASIAFAGVMMFSMTTLGMYQINFKEGIRNTLLRLMPAVAFGFGTMMILFYLIPFIYFGRGILVFATFFAGAGILTVRILFFKSSEFKLLEERIIIVGVGPLAKECTDLAMNNIAYHKYNIIGYIQASDEEPSIPTSSILPMQDSLMDTARKYNVEEIIVSVQNKRGGGFPIQELLKCKLSGMKVTDAASFFEREACQIRLDSLVPSWLVFGGGFDQSFFRVFSKRLFDLFASLLLLIITLPIMSITALLIYIEDRAPIFYRQERVGKDGHPFMVMKFRSMWNDAEKGLNPQWASANDPRTTRVGRIIRKLRIDELPQILNVLKGEMSFVGPRPERPYFVEQLCEEVPYYNERHTIKPGITGLAQVRYAYGASVEDSIQKLQYDLYYVKNNSLFLDVLIMVETVQVVLFGKGQ
jgi:sugar transferase (PEP-CTERM system associated)